jgi:GLPGLI family protein
MRLIPIVLLILLSSSNFAQNISGQAFYESKTTVDMDEINIGREISEEMKKMIATQMKSVLEKTYILTFNKDESIYKEQEKLENNPMMGGFQMMTGSFMPGPQYKDLKTGQIVEEKEFFGKEFLITDSIPKLDWKLEKESKQIGEYVVFKATAIKKVDSSDLQMARPKKQDDNEKDKTDSDDQDPMDLIEIPKEVEVTAWYTPQIPVSNGPGEYGGLPGLIMELSVNRTTILCSKIILNAKSADKIERPKKGKKVSREEYTKIITEKMQEMQDNFRNSGGRRGGFGG